MARKRTSTGPSAAKARTILHDGTVHGQPLTDKQRRFMGARASGKPSKSGDAAPDTPKTMRKRREAARRRR